MDVLDIAVAKTAAKKYTDEKIENISSMIDENIGEVIQDYLDDHPISGLTYPIKEAILNFARSVAYVNNNTAFNDLYNALMGGNVPIYNWNFKEGLTDSVTGLAAIGSYGTATDHAPIQSASGLVFDAPAQCITLPGIYDRDRTYEIDIANFNMQGDDNTNIRFFMIGSSTNGSRGLLIWRNNTSSGGNSRWNAYVSAWDNRAYDQILSGKNIFANSTVKITIASDGTVSLYIDDGYIGSLELKAPERTDTLQNVFIGNTASVVSGTVLYNATITGFRVYEGVVV